MTMRPRLQQALIQMFQRFPRQKLDDTRGTVKAYMEDLDDIAALDEQSVINATIELRKSSQWIPSVKEIRETAVDLMDRDLWVIEAAAWGEVIDAITRYGEDKKTVVLRVIDGKEYGVEEVFPGFSSPIIARAVESIGWRELCRAQESEYTALRAQLREAIKAIQRRFQYELVSGRGLPDVSQIALAGDRSPRSMSDVISGMIAAGRPATHEERAPDDATDPTETQGQAREENGREGPL